MVIDIFAIPGVTIPTLGGTPATFIISTTQYTGTITWAHSGGAAGANFGAARVYTAIITLTPETGFTLTGVAANSFTVAGAISVTHDADSGVITAVFPVTAALLQITPPILLPPTPTSAPPSSGETYIPPVEATPLPFIDVAVTDWFYPYVRVVWENQLFHGTSHNTFAPQSNMTRAMFVQVLANLEGVNLNPYRNQAPIFNDVSAGAWYFPAIQWAASQGLVRGVGNNNFAPSAPATREQIAVMLNNYVVSRGIELPASLGAASIFTDHSNISYWALESVLAMQAAGIITGYPDGSFNPQGTATRAEVAAIFARFWEKRVN